MNLASAVRTGVRLTVGEALEGARRQLGAVTDTPALEAQLLVGRALGRSRTWILAHPEAEVLPAQVRQFSDDLASRVAGVPLPYLLGGWEFYGLHFRVTPDVLIPRPETEHLVELALDFLRERGGAPAVLEIGTGSGCIAVAVAANDPAAQITAVDISEAALAVAEENARRHGVTSITFLKSDLHSNVPVDAGPFDLVLANLPYIPAGQLDALPVASHEPRMALDGGADGLALIRRLMSRLPKLLAAGGLALLEIEASQGGQAVGLARRAFAGAGIDLLQDATGRDRILAVRPGAAVAGKPAISA